MIRCPNVDREGKFHVDTLPKCDQMKREKAELAHLGRSWQPVAASKWSLPAHCTLHFHYGLYTFHCALYTFHCALYTFHFSLWTLHFSLQFTLFTVDCAFCTFHCTQCTLHLSVDCALFTFHCGLCTLHFSHYTLPCVCTLYSVQGTLLTQHYTSPKTLFDFWGSSGVRNLAGGTDWSRKAERPSSTSTKHPLFLLHLICPMSIPVLPPSLEEYVAAAQ